jgi:multidrug transporter EmrE-like cation transporter
MPLFARLRWLFLANATVLVTHQIDAGYWHEWELFLIPGGNQVNLLLNIPIIALVMYSHSRVVSNIHTGLAFYKLLAALGFLTVGIHSFFFLQGNESFAQSMSVALLIATFVLSVWQLVALRGLEKLTVLAAQ